MVRDILKSVGLRIDQEFSQYPWQIWAGSSDAPETRILQENGTNPAIADYSENLVSGIQEMLRGSPGMVPRYICYVWQHPSISPLISEKRWYWLSKDDGVNFEKLRPMYIRDAAGPHRLRWAIVLGETKIRRSL